MKGKYVPASRPEDRFGDRNDLGVARDMLIGALRRRQVRQDARRALNFWIDATDTDLIELLVAELLKQKQS